VGRTLLSDAVAFGVGVDLAFDFEPGFSRLAQVKINRNINGVGHECPSHTMKQSGDGRGEKNWNSLWDGEYVSTGAGGEDQFDECSGS
jgi:hypothetical protein